MELVKLPLSEIHIDDDFNCRGTIAPIDVADLADDIKKHGLIQPVTVEVYSPEKQEATGYKYRLIAGYRRTYAHKYLQMEKIDAIIHAPMTDAEALILNFQENGARANLNILQEARALRKMLDLGIGEFEAADKLGKSRGWVQVRYLLLKLPKEIQEEVGAGYITQDQIRELYTTYNSGGLEATYAMVKAIKVYKSKGLRYKKPKKYTERKAPDKKIRRAVPEIMQLIDHFADTVGMGLHTRVLAWAAGEITNRELDASIHEYAVDHNREYTYKAMPTPEDVE